jgi:DinB superfamily
MAPSRKRSPHRPRARRQPPSPADAILRKHLVKLLEGGEAHIEFDQAVEDFPAELRGVKPAGAPHTPWQLIEHMRIAQWDILKFSRNPRHVSPEWPRGYWPPSEAPASEAAWGKSLESFRRDRKELIKLVKDPATNVMAPIRHGQGQTILREALLVADHDAYHLGQLVLVRRLLGAWPER